MDHPVDIQKLSPQAQKICNKGAPQQLKEMAAGGLAPLKPLDLVTVLYVLSYDEDAAISDKAKNSLSGTPENIVLSVIEQLGDAQILDGVIRLLPARPVLMQKVLLNRSAAAESVVWIIENTTDDQTLETAVSNEERMLRFPEIIEALYRNKAARMSTVDRAVELAVRNGVELTGLPCFREIKAALTGIVIPPKTQEPTADDKVFINNVEASTFAEISDEMVDAVFEESADQSEEQKQKVLTAQQSLARMTVSAKIRVATLGSSVQRAILIRDSNKLVVMSVVKSPAMSDGEVLRISKFRTLPEEAVRYIAGHREWTKHYSVKLNLVQNPRCPMEFTLRFMPHLRGSDLKIVARDKNVPQAVARAAKQLILKRDV
jgi:hypothetical protein